MIGRGVEAFIEALLGDRSPKGFPAGSEDAAVLRVAVALRAGRPGERGPDEQFVATLHRQLAEDADELARVERSDVGRRAAQTASLRSLSRTRAFRGLAGIAAAAALVGGTVTMTNAVDHPSGSGAAQLALGSSLRFGNLHRPDGRLIGQVFIHQGDPSWIFMTMHDAAATGTVMCELRLANGTTVPVGTVQIHGGGAQMARSLVVDASQVRGARLVASSGTTVASAELS